MSLVFRRGLFVAALQDVTHSCQPAIVMVDPHGLVMAYNDG